MINKDLGLVTAYAYAVSKGYTGTEDEFAELMASYASVAEQAEESAEDSEAWAVGKRGGTDVPSTDATYHNNSKYYADQAGTIASTAASSAATATEKAGEASTSASEASTSATSAAGSATNAASSATAASASATAAGNAQAAAETAQGKAEDAQEAAEQAQSDAEAAAQSVSQSAAQISQNTSDIGDLKSALNELIVVPFEVQGNGYYDYPDAQLLSADSWRYTKPIKLLAGVEYTFKSLNYTAASAITLCDEDGNNRVAKVRGRYDGAGVYTEVTYTPETDCYVILSYNVGLEPHFYVVKRLDTIINTGLTNKKYVTELNQAVGSGSTAKPGKNLFNPETSNPGYLGSNGTTLTVYQDWYTTDYIYVHDCTNIYTSCKHNGTRVALPMYFCCIYNANKECITQFNPQNNPYQIIDTVYYIRFSYHANTDIDIQVENNTESTNYEPFQLKYDFLGKRWANCKWTCMGDSLTEHNQRTRSNYHDFVSQATSIQVVNLGKSGSGYMSNPGYRFYERVSEVPIDSNVVTIFGSGNDLSYTLGEPTDTGTSTICGAINTTIDNLVTRMPRVSLGIVAPTPWEDYPPYVEGNAMSLYVDALKTICEMRSIPFLDLYHKSNLRPWTAEGRAACYSKDDGNGTHPDEYGHKLIAPKFKAFLESLLM